MQSERTRGAWRLVMAALAVGFSSRLSVSAFSMTRLPSSHVRRNLRTSSLGLRGAMTARSISEVKRDILQIAAATDRGQRLNQLVAPVYQESRGKIANLVDVLAKVSVFLPLSPCLNLVQNECEISETSLSGEWELVYSDVELFRSSPFFLAIEQALDTSPGIPLLGKWLGQ
eukprot:768320-Hanusia_phi.AAC.8